METAVKNLSNHLTRDYWGIKPDDWQLEEIAEAVGVTGADAHLILCSDRDKWIGLGPQNHELTLGERLLLRSEMTIRAQLGEAEPRVPDSEIKALIPMAAVYLGVEPKLGGKARDIEKRAQLKRRIQALRKKHNAAY